MVSGREVAEAEEVEVEVEGGDEGGGCAGCVDCMKKGGGGRMFEFRGGEG